jgi:hypothetical protein
MSGVEDFTSEDHFLKAVKAWVDNFLPQVWIIFNVNDFDDLIETLQETRQESLLISMDVCVL